GGEGGGELDAALVHLGEGLLEGVALGGLAVPAAALDGGAAPALDGLGDDGEGLAPDVGGTLVELVEDLLDLSGGVAVDDADIEAVGLEFGLDALLGLLGGDAVGLAVLVAVENGEDVGELAVHDEVEGLGDLAFAGFAVADDAVDAPIDLV